MLRSALLMHASQIFDGAPLTQMLMKHRRCPLRVVRPPDPPPRVVATVDHEDASQHALLVHGLEKWLRKHHFVQA